MPFPVKDAPVESMKETSVPNPRKVHRGEHNVGSSPQAPGHKDSMNRMPHPFKDGFAPTDETGEGLNK